MSEESEQVDVDELKGKVQEAIKEDGSTEEVVLDPEYTDNEQKAMAMGWNPDEESLKDTDKDWIPAAEFLRNQTFFTEIKKLKREVRKQQKVTEAFKQQNVIVAEKAYDKAYKDLKRQKLQAAEEEDFSKILQIDEQIEDLRDEKQNAQAMQQAQYTKEDWDDAFEVFVDDNSWYQEDRTKQALADSVGMEYINANPGSHPSKVYEYVINEVNAAFKKEEPAPVQRAQAVASPQRSASAANSGSKHIMSDIPDEHRQIAMTLVKTGAVSEEDYLKQYFPEDYS